MRRAEDISLLDHTSNHFQKEVRNEKRNEEKVISPKEKEKSAIALFFFDFFILLSGQK